MTKPPINETEIFNVAVKLAPEQRTDYLDQICRENQQLRREVESLLRAHDGGGSFLDRPALAATCATASIEVPGSMIGPYKIREQLGEGGFGVVYVAEQERPIRRKVALKVIKPGMDSKDVIARFEAERQVLALLDHPNVARVLDAGTTDHGRPYFVMELVQGISITDFCNTNRLPTRKRLMLLADVAQAVHHAHQKGIIHRDLKPSNVMVTLHDGKPVVKVIDFGISKALNQRMTERSIYTAYGQMIGTPAYMSPEQAELSGLGVDTRSDIYSLGVIAYELLTGRTPLDAKRLRESAYAEILRIIREEEPPRPSQKVSTLAEQASALARQQQTEPDQLRKALAGDIDWIVMKCLEKDRSRRYETANALVRDIERYLHDEPVEACPPSVWYRVGKFSRKHRSLLATSTIVVLLLLIATAVSSWLAIRERRATQLANQETLKASRSLQREIEQRELATRSAASAKASQEQLRKALYGVKMNLIQTAAARHQHRQVRSLLDSLIPEPGQSDLRRFEWYYWHRKLSLGTPQTRQLPEFDGQVILRGGPHGPRAFFAAIEMPETDPSGTPLTEEGSDAHAVVIKRVDVATGRVAREWTLTHFQKPYGAVSVGRPTMWRFENIDVSDDGSRMAVFYDTKQSTRVELYDTDAADPIMDLDLTDSVSAVGLNRDGSRMVVVSYPKQEDDERSFTEGITYQVWDTQDRHLVYELAEPGRKWMSRTAVLNADGSKLSRTLHLADDTSKASQDVWLVELLDIASKSVQWTKELSGVAVHYHAWSPDGRWLAMRLSAPTTGVSNAGIHLLDSETGERRSTLFSKQHSGVAEVVIRDIIFSPDSQRIASFADNSVDIWDVPSVVAQTQPEVSQVAIVNSPLLSLMHGGAPILGLEFSADTAELIGVTRDNALTWSLDGLNAEHEFLLSPASILSISRTAERLALKDGEAPISIWNPVTRRRVCELEQQAGTESTLYHAFSTDHRRIMTLERVSGEPLVSATAKPCVYDGETGRLIRRFDTRTAAINSNASDLSYSGDHVAVIAGQSFSMGAPEADEAEAPQPELQLWDVHSGMMIQSRTLISTANARRRWGVLYVGDGSELAVIEFVAPDSCRVHLYDALSLNSKRTIDCPTAELRFERSRQSICEKYANGDTVIRSLLTGETEVRLQVAGRYPFSCTKSHDGSRIATFSTSESSNPYSVGARATELIIWDAETGDRLFSTTLDDVGITTQIAFTSDDRQLVVASPHGTQVSLTVLDAK